MKCVCVLRPAIFALVFIDDEANLEISTTFRNCSKEEMCEGRVKLSKKLPEGLSPSLHFACRLGLKFGQCCVQCHQSDSKCWVRKLER